MCHAFPSLLQIPRSPFLHQYTLSGWATFFNVKVKYLSLNASFLKEINFFMARFFKEIFIIVNYP